MSINGVRKAIQDINLTNFRSVNYSYGTATGTTKIQHAPDELPNSLTSDELPCALVFATTGTWPHETFGPEGEACRRNYEVRVYVGVPGQGVDGEYYARAEALLQAMGGVYVNKCDLDEGVWHDWTVADTGVISGERMMYAGQSYIGFIFTLNAETWE